MPTQHLTQGRRPHMTTASTGLLCWRDLHPLEWQLASLHQILTGPIKTSGSYLEYLTATWPGVNCGLPYAVERLCHANPALCPVRALLTRVPLGPRPLLHRLRSGHAARFVRRLPSSYGGV